MATRSFRSGTDLVIEDRPWFFGLLLSAGVVGMASLFFHAVGEARVGLAALAVGLAALLLYAMKRAVRLTRLRLGTDGSATLTIRDHGGTTERSFPPGTLRAGLETHRSGDGETCRAVLLVDGKDGVERVPFTAYFSSGRSGETTVRAIMDWRGDPARTEG